MREFLTDTEVRLLKTYAEYSMRVRPTADAMHYDRRTVFGMLSDIHKKTGFDPKDFFGLRAIMDRIEKEGEQNGG